MPPYIKRTRITEITQLKKENKLKRNINLDVLLPFREYLGTYSTAIKLLDSSTSSFHIFHLVLRLLGNVVKICTQQLDTLNVVPLVELLVDGVSAVS